jgi:lipid-A-disaccharide synthase-like uncharacterized protein
MTSSLIVYAIGFTAQIFFSARTLVQWILSEKRHQVVSPTVFWVLSLMGSVLLFAYGWLRNDFSIILGQLISYYVYIWNLKIKGLWPQVPALLRYALTLLPVAALVHLFVTCSDFAGQFLLRGDLPFWLLAFGCLGQVVFTCRFIYQWYYSRQRHESVLPLGFWIISLTGSAIIVIYGAIRLDPVLIVGQAFGVFTYIRNISIWEHQEA